MKELHNPEITGKATPWSKKLKKHVGIKVKCFDFENGLPTEGYEIYPDGSLRFFNELRSLPGTMKNSYMNHWSSKKKNNFLVAVRKKAVTKREIEEKEKEYRFTYIGDDNKDYKGKYRLHNEGEKIVLDSFGYYDYKTREWIDCDRGDVLPEEIQDAWENGKTVRK